MGEILTLNIFIVTSDGNMMDFREFALCLASNSKRCFLTLMTEMFVETLNKQHPHVLG